VILSVEIGDVGSPEFFGFGAFLLDPFGDASEDMAASLPVAQVGRTANGKLSSTFWSIIGSKDDPPVPVLDNGGIVGVLNIAPKLNDGRGWLRDCSAR
jgi:hypothetical protein